VELSQRARVRAGDHDEFGVLFEEHIRAVYNHAFRLTGNWSAAEEVVSLTFLEAWRLRGTVRPEGGSLLPWLLGIALNVARNVARAARRQQAAMSRLPADSQPGQPGQPGTHRATCASTSPAPARATSATPAIGCCSPSPLSRTRCSPTSRPERSGPTTTRPPRSAT